MDGKVLSQIFEQTKEISTIESWEAVKGACGMHSEKTAEDEDIAEMVWSLNNW